MRSIIVPANDEDPTPVVEFVSEELEQYDYSSRALYQIEVAIEEILVNIVSYAGLTENDGIEIRCGVFEDPLRAVVQFIDGGIPFDPLAKEDPDVTLSAADRPVGGLGVFMVKQSMDDVKYEYKDGANILTLTKSL